MSLQVFTVRDDKAEAFMNPFFMPNQALAVRSIQQCMADPEHTFARFPEDFSLYILGEYDEQSGKFTLLDAPQHMANLVTLD